VAKKGDKGLNIPQSRLLGASYLEEILEMGNGGCYLEMKPDPSQFGRAQIQVGRKSTVLMTFNDIRHLENEKEMFGVGDGG